MTHMRALALSFIVTLSALQSSQIRAEGPECRAVKTGQVIHFRGSQAELQALLKSNATVVVDFTATWCGPCKKMKPIFSALAQEMTDVLFIAVDVDEFESIAYAYGVTSMPTFLFFQNGKQVKRESGGKTKEKLRQMIRSL